MNISWATNIPSRSQLHTAWYISNTRRSNAATSVRYTAARPLRAIVAAVCVSKSEEVLASVPYTGVEAWPGICGAMSRLSSQPGGKDEQYVENDHNASLLVF